MIVWQFNVDCHGASTGADKSFADQRSGVGNENDDTELPGFDLHNEMQISFACAGNRVRKHNFRSIMPSVRLRR